MNRLTGTFFRAFFLSFLLALLSGCGAPYSGPNSWQPMITSFAANPTAVTAGGSTGLTGVFTNGTGVITPGNISVTSGTSVSVSPIQTTTYILTVTNTSGGSAVQTATVTVSAAAPAITRFVANPTTVTAGGTTSLTGVFTGGTGVITPGNIAATSGTAVSVTPTDTTTYTLTVTNTAGVTVIQTATVTVNPVAPAGPTITSFTANPTTITAGASTNLTGVFTGGTGVITPGKISATSGTAVSVTPADTTTYTLTVTNSAGVTAAKTVVVTVNPVAPAAPTITSFIANPASITVGGSTNLTGVFTGGTGIITPGNLAATSGTAVSVTPADTTTYTLTVTNSAGVTASKTAIVTVLSAQTITFANPGTQTEGTPLTLSATASSGLTVAFASTTPTVCTVSGTTATFLTAGTCSITASQSGNATYAAATPVPEGFTVNASGLTAQTITFADPGTQTVGTPLTLSATASSGLTVSFTSTTTSVCTVSGTTATFLTAGTCTIDANQAGNGTYAQAPMVPASFSVTASSSGLYTLPSEYTTLWQPGVTYNGGIPTNRTQCGATLCPAGQTASGSSCTGTASGGDDTTTINNAINACADNTFLLLGPGTFHVAGSGAGIQITRSNFTLRGSGANSAGSPGTLISETNKQEVISIGDMWFHWSFDSTCTACNNATNGACVNCTTTTLGKCTNPGPGMFPLAADVVKESNSLMVTSSSVAAASPALQVGELLAVTEQFDPTIEWYNENQENSGNGPGQCGVWDFFNGGNSPGGACGAGSTEDQNDAILGADEYPVSRPTGQVNQLTQIHDNGDGTTTLTFAAPFHTPFRVSLGGDVVRAKTAGNGLLGLPTSSVGIEDLSVAHAQGDGGIVFYYTANSWAKNIESYDTFGAAVLFEGAFRSELRDSYIHTAGNPYPGGAGYGIAIDDYTSDTLVENNISWSFNKVMVMGSGGGGNVVAYNYFEDGYGGNYGNCPCPSGWSGCSTSQDPLGQNGPVPWASACSGILEVGANAAHGTNTHYTLFEGNQSYNIDEDSTWGNSNYNIFFRNHATTSRRNIGNGSGTETGADFPDTCTSFSCFGPMIQLGDWQNRRGIGITSHHWWHAYVGNVIGYPNGYLANPAIGYAYPSFSPQPVYTTWIYELTGANNSGFDGSNDVPIWQLAYVSPTEADQPSAFPGADTRTVLNTIIRDGNYDYFSKLVHWHGVPTNLGVGATNYGPLCTNGNSTCATEYVAPPAASTLPKSMYIPTNMQPPAFFNGGTWPWIDGTNASNPIPGTLPARMRFDAGTPNTVP